jgi:hypothetical protein
MSAGSCGATVTAGSFCWRLLIEARRDRLIRSSVVPDVGTIRDLDVRERGRGSGKRCQRKHGEKKSPHG